MGETGLNDGAQHKIGGRGAKKVYCKKPHPRKETGLSFAKENGKRGRGVLSYFQWGSQCRG